MATPLDPKELVTLEEIALSNMWEITALVFDLPKKGLTLFDNQESVMG